MAKRRWIQFALMAGTGLLVLGLAAAYWAKRSPWLSARLHAPIQAALAKASGRPVSLGGVGGGLSGWIWLQDVGLGPDPAGRAVDLSLTAKAVGLRFALTDLLLGKTGLENLKALRVDDPAFYLLRRQAAVSVSPAARADQDWRQALQGFPLPAVRLELRNGQAYEQLEKEAPRLLVQGLRAGLEPDEQGWRLRGQAELESGGRVALWGKADKAMRAAELKARASGIRVAPWAAWAELPPALKVAEGVLRGELDLVQDAAGAWRLAGRGELEGLSAQWRGREILHQGSSRWSWDKDGLSLSFLRGKSAEGSLEGALRWQAGRGVVGRVSLARADLRQLAELAGAPQGLSLVGRADLGLSAAAGPLSATAWTLDLHGREARWLDHHLTRVELRGQSDALSRHAEALLAWDGGQGDAQLSFAGTGLSGAQVRVQGLPAAWAGSFSGLSISGSVEGHWTYQAQGAAHPWELDLKSPALQLQGLRLEGLHLSGAGGAKQVLLRLEADLEHWKGLNASAEAVALGEAWILKRLRVFERDQLRAEASGRWEGRQGQLDLKKAELPLGPLRPWLPEALQALSGTVRALGALRWDGQAASGGLDLDGALSAHGQALALAGRLQFAPTGVSLSALDLRKGELKGAMQAARWSGPWSAQWQLQRAQLAAWTALLGSPGLLSGSASGSLSLQEGSLSAVLQAQDPWPLALPKASLDLALNGSDGFWELKDLHLRQGAGSLTAQGTADLKGRGRWAGQAKWQGLKLNGADLGGEGTLSPQAGAVGLLAIGPWSLSGTALPDLQAELKPQEGRLQAVVARLGAHTELSLRRAVGAWALKGRFQGQDPAPLMAPWTGRSQASGLTLDGSAELSWGTGLAWKADLVDAAAPASRLQAEGGEKVHAARFSGLDLGRWAEALRRLGLAELPFSAGTVEGAMIAHADGLSVTAQAQGLRALGVDLGPADLSAWIGPKRWTLARLNAGGSGPQLSLRQWSGNRSKAWSAEGTVTLEQWPAAIFVLAGEGALKLKGQSPKVTIESRWERLKVGEREYQGLGLRATWDQGRLHVAESSKPSAWVADASIKDGDFELRNLQALAGKGKAGLKGRVGKDGALSFEGQASGFPAGELTGWLGWAQAWTGAAYGSLSLSGKTSETHGVISVKIEDGSVAGLPFDLATGLVYLEPGWVQLSPLRPIRLNRRNGVALEVSGKVPLGGGGAQVPQGLDVQAELKGGGLGLLAGLPVIDAADGPLELSLQFSGRRDDPRVDGRVRVQGGNLTPAWLLPPMEGVEVFGQIEDGQFILHKALAQVAGDGPLLKLELADSSRPAFVFERWLPSSMNLRLRASRSGLPLRSTKALRFIDGQAHPDLRLAGSWAAPELQGTLHLEKGLQDKAVVLWPPQWAKAVGPAQQGGFFDKMSYQMRLIARQDVMVRTEAAQVFVDSGEEGLLLSGGGEERELEGRLRFTRGSIDYLLANFQLASDKETRIDFRRGVAPDLDLWGVKRVRDAQLNNEVMRRDVDVRLHAFGPLGEVQMRLEADDPNLTQQQLASLAGLGADTSDPRYQGGFARMLGRVPARFLTNLVRRSGVVDEVGVRLPAVEDALAGAPRTPGPGEEQSQALTTGSRTLVSVDAGKYIGERLYLGGNLVVQEKDGLEAGQRTVNPAVGGKLEYELRDNTRLSAQHNVDTDGQSEQKLMLERSTRFENYNPRKRRWDQMTPTPGPRSRQTPPAPPSLDPSP